MSTLLRGRGPGCLQSSLAAARIREQANLRVFPTATDDVLRRSSRVTRTGSSALNLIEQARTIAADLVEIRRGLHHRSDFDIDESAIPVGAAALAAGAGRLLQEMAGSNDNTEDN